MKIEEIHKDNCKKIRLISKKTKQLICERIMTESEKDTLSGFVELCCYEE